MEGRRHSNNNSKENIKAFKTQFEQNNVIDIAIRNINEIL
jgi:hypothetical protein